MWNPRAGNRLFSLFGVTRRNREWLAARISSRLGIAPAVIPYPNGECGFYYTTHGEVQETGESACLKLGFLRSPDGLPLSVEPALERRLDPDDFPSGCISGNGYLVRFHRFEPRLAIFMTFMATSQVYYAPWEGGVLFCTDLPVLLRLIGRVELNEEALPLHLMFRTLPGPATYFKDVSRMFPGDIIAWRDGALEVRRRRDMYAPAEKPAHDHLDSAIFEEYFDRLSAIMRSYVREIERRHGSIANQLSGGVDSSLVQLLISRQLPQGQPPLSLSFTFEAQGFQFEIEYARQASEMLGTRHTFVEVPKRDYVDLLIKSVENLGHPMIIAENDPGHMVLAQHLAAGSAAPHYVFAGQGADVLQGSDVDECTANLDALHYAFGESWRLFGTPVFRKKVGGLLDVSRYLFMASTYRCLRTPPDLFDPVNRVAIPYTSFETVRHFLGDEVIMDCLEYRQRLAEETLTSHTLVEHLHDIDLVTMGYGPATAFEALFAASGQVLIPFYFDQDVVRLVKSIAPEVRYQQNGEVKPIPKSILRLKGLEKIVHQRKGSSGFWREFQTWMMTGILRDMVHSIERPGFISQKDFAALIENRHPYGYDLVWPLLTYDIFRKHVASQQSQTGEAQAWQPGDGAVLPPSGTGAAAGSGQAPLL